MATEDLVTEQFQFLGIDVQKDVLTKCVKLCEEYNIDAETFVEQWMAFSLSHLNGAPPSINDLEVLERKEFSKRTFEQHTVPTETPQNAGSTLMIYGVENDEQPEKDVISNYVSTTPKRIKRETDSAVSELRPATYSPTVGHSAKYATRTNAGSVVHSFGDNKLLEELSQPTNVNNILNLNATQVPNDDGDLYTKAMFGYELLHEKASIYDNHICYLSQCILKKINVTETCSVRHKTQSEVYVRGRIECDADARLNPKSVVLQGDWEQSLSQSVPLDIDNVSQYSLFPGQVVVARGVNPQGDRFTAHQLYADASLTKEDHRADLTNAFTGTMSIVAVSGPYTVSDNLSYEPLKDLVSYIGVHKPHIVIMTGPFLDCEHPKVKDNTMAETYKSFFDKLLDILGDISNTSPMTKLYLVSSPRDAFHVNVSPTPPYCARRPPPTVTLLPSPATLLLGGLVLAVTSEDVLMQISQEEISLGMSGDKLSRLSRHLQQQQSLAPLGGGDAALWAAHAQLPRPPHLLLLPSSFRYFVKNVDGCIVVNPERLTKGVGGGTFARILVNINSSTENISDGIAAQIVRI